MSSFKAYGKVNEAEQARLEAYRRTRKRITIICVSSILLVAIVVAAVVGSHVSRNGGGDQAKPLSTSIKAVCDVTLYKESCYTSLSPLAQSNQLQPQDLFKLSIQVAMNQLSKASQYLSDNNDIDNDNMTTTALKDCQDLLSLAMDHLNSSLASADDVSVAYVIENLRTWLSAAGSCQQTCIDGLEEAKLIKATAQNHLKNTTELTSNSLAIITWIYKVASSVNMRRLMSHDEKVNVPEWLHRNDRKLLQTQDLKKKANVVVAQDGSGKYRTIGAALKAVPDKSKERFIIYVKKGVYKENVRVEKSKWNVMMVGDGMDATIVSGTLNFVDGTPTFSSATFAVLGKGFIARDMGFYNTAGPTKHQAVAMMSTADQSVFYRCSFNAFQDTLYAHSNRQFYRECNITGTVDFIFGNSAVVIQNSNILPRRPMAGQKNTITAQGRFDPNQNTGISIQNCTVQPYDNLTGIQSFLGRPWKNYSTTVFMQTTMGNLIDSSGWLPWTGNTAPPTIFYSEFQNFGPGSSTNHRVKWRGLKTIDKRIATKFTVKEFLQGDKWVPHTGITYHLGL